MAQPSPAGAAAPVRTTWLVCLGLVALTWAVFGQTLRFPFITFDDELYVYENRAVLGGLTVPGAVWAFTHVMNANWHPLTVMSHMLDCSIFGLNAGGHHFTNVSLHSLAVVLLFLVLRDMTGTLWRSAFVAAVFAIHPLHVESVAWVSERKDVLSALFFFFSLGAYARYARARSLARYLAVAVFFALGLMCKPMLVTLPFVLLLLDYWPLQRFGRAEKRRAAGSSASAGRLLLEKLPLFALSAVSCCVTIFAQTKTIAAMHRLTMSSRIGNALVASAIYLRQMFVPVDLALLYPNPDRIIPWWQIGVGLALIAAITAWAWRERQKRPYLVTGWLWYLIMLGPVLGIVQVGLQAHADRYTYLPQVGLYLMVAWLMTDLFAAWPRAGIILTTSAALVLLPLTVLAWQQTSLWSDSLKLWEHAAAVTNNNDVAEAAASSLSLKRGNLEQAVAHARREVAIRPNSDEGHFRLGVAFFRQHRLDEALAEFAEVVKLRPNYPDLHSNIATVLLEQGRVNDAIAEFQRALSTPREERDPNDTGYDAGGSKYRDDALLHTNFGAALARRGEWDEALAQFRQALALQPTYPKVHYNIGNVAMQRGDLETAVAEFRKELELRPNDAQSHADLGVVLSQKRQVREALAEWQKALAADPDNLNAACNLAWVLATQPDPSIRNGAEAVEMAQHAVDLSGGTNPRILRLLAAAKAETGDFDKAIEVAQKAAELARAQNDSSLAETLARNIELFQARQPLRD